MFFNLEQDSQAPVTQTLMEIVFDGKKTLLRDLIGAVRILSGISSKVMMQVSSNGVSVGLWSITY